MELYEQQLRAETIYTGRVFSVRRDEVRLPDGRQALREVVEHNGGAAVLALTGDRLVPMVRQYRYGAGRVLLEIPAGKIENGEAPLACGTRELREECGHMADSWESLGILIPTGAYCGEVNHLFLARGLTDTARAPDADEFLEVEYVPFADALDMAADGRVIDAKTIIALFRAARMIGEF